MGGVILEKEFIIDEISPVYLTEAEARDRVEQLVAELIAILDDD